MRLIATLHMINIRMWYSITQQWRCNSILLGWIIIEASHATTIKYYNTFKLEDIVTINQGHLNKVQLKYIVCYNELICHHVVIWWGSCELSGSWGRWFQTTSSSSPVVLWGDGRIINRSCDQWCPINCWCWSTISSTSLYLQMGWDWWVLSICNNNIIFC